MEISTKKKIETKPKTAISLIKCACILQNFVRECDGDSDTDYIQVTATVNYDSTQINTDEQSRYNRSSNRALNIRNELKLYFWDFRD